MEDNRDFNYLRIEAARINRSTQKSFDDLADSIMSLAETIARKFPTKTESQKEIEAMVEKINKKLWDFKRGTIQAIYDKPVIDWEE